MGAREYREVGGMYVCAPTNHLEDVNTLLKVVSGYKQIGGGSSSGSQSFPLWGSTLYRLLQELIVRQYAPIRAEHEEVESQ